MDRLRLFQTLLFVCLVQGRDFKGLQFGSDGGRHYLYNRPVLSRLFSNPLGTPSVPVLSPFQRPATVFFDSNDRSPLGFTLNRDNVASPIDDDETEARRFLKTSEEKKTLAVNVSNIPLRTILDKPAEVTSMQLKDSIAAIGSAIGSLTNLLQNQMSTRRCPASELLSLGIACGKFGSNCYCAPLGRELTFDQADQYCKAIGMDGLLSLQTSAKEFLLATTLNFEGISDPIWTSGTDAGSLGSFYWKTTGEALTYTNWASGEPTTRTGPSCVQIGTGGDGKWVTDSCSTATAPFICELKDASSSLPTSG